MVKNSEGKAERVLTEVEDCFQLEKIVQGRWLNEQEFVVLLDDGHEEARDKEVPKSSGRGSEIKRVREWIASQLILSAEDALRLKRMSGSLFYVDEGPKQEPSNL